MEPRDYPRCVTTTILVLDEFDPGWWRSIRTSTLRLYSGDDCICGQRFGSFKEGLAVLEARGCHVFDHASLVDAIKILFGKGNHPAAAFFGRTNGSNHRAWVSEVQRRHIAEVNQIAQAVLGRA
jgi:hypothetical protein